MTLCIVLGACKSQRQYFVKTVEFPKEATPEAKNRNIGPGSADRRTISLAAIGVDCFYSFWQKYIYRAEWGDG